MGYLTDEQLNKSLKEGLQPLYLLYGSETRLLQNTVKKIQTLGVEPAFETFNLQTFDESVTLDQLQTAYEALPMMAPQKVVLVRDWDVAKLTTANHKVLMEMLSPPNPSTVLVLYYTGVEYDPKKKASSKKLVELIAKHGTVCSFGIKDRATLKRALASNCKKAGVTLSPAVADLLIDRCGMQYGRLQSELDKLIAYADGGEITAEAVRMLCQQTFQDRVFDLCDALLKNQANQAFHILDHLLEQEEEPIALIGAMTMSFGDLYRAKAGQVAGLPLSQVVADFNYGRASFRITKQQSLLSKFSLARVRHCIEALSHANLLLISSKMEDRIILEQMIGQMIAYQS